MLFENAATDTQSVAAFGVGLGEGVGVGVGVGFGVGVGVGVGVGDTVALGVGLLLALGDALGVAVAVGVALGVGLAVTVLLGAAEAELLGVVLTAAVSLAAVAGRLAHAAVVALAAWVRMAWASAVPGKPPEMMNIPARTLRITVWARRKVTAAPMPRRPWPRGYRSSSLWPISYLMSRTTHSLLSSFDTFGCAERHSPRGKVHCRELSGRQRGGQDGST